MKWILGCEERSDSSGCSLRQGAGYRAAYNTGWQPGPRCCRRGPLPHTPKLAASCLPVMAGDPELTAETGRALVNRKRGTIWIQVQRKLALSCQVCQ